MNVVPPECSALCLVVRGIGKKKAQALPYGERLSMDGFLNSNSFLDSTSIF